MQLYVLDRAKNTLATTSSFYNDKHHKELTAGASIFEFTIDKSDSAAQYMTTGNYLVFKDDRGRAWSFTILSYDETQTTKTVAAEDVSIELLNKAMDVWSTTQTYPFSYYFNLVTKDTPWKLGINQVADLSRKLVYTGRDTGLGRLLSVLKGFDNAECQFNIKVQQNKPVEFVVDVYKSIGTVQDNIQIVYNNELADIKKTESRAQFVTALAGVGGLVENQETTDPGLEKHIDFTDIYYKDDNFVSPKGDKFLRAVTANRTFNPGTTTYIEDFYDYDTQSAQELLNRTLTQLKERSEPQYTYNADVKVIDPTLDIGDMVTIIDHDYNPALYLQARVATLDKSYTDPTQGAITFCNYRVLNSNLSDQLRAMQNIIDQLPTSESVKLINSNIIKIIATNEELKKQVALSFESANGKSRVWFSRSSTAQDGDVAFVKNADGVTEIWAFVEGVWTLDTGIATFDDVKKAASAAADAGSQAVIAGQQASAAGADAKSAGDFAASAASQSAIETAAAQSAANSAVNQANLAISQAGFANNTADQAKTDAANAVTQASTAYNAATSAVSNAQSALSAATSATATTKALSFTVDDINGTIKNLATTETVNKLTGTVSSAQALAQLAADGLAIKADKTTVDTLKDNVDKNTANIKVNATSISAKVTASDVTGMLNGYATQSWSQGQISAAKNEISASVETVKNQVDNSAVGTNLLTNTGNLSANWGGQSSVSTTTEYNGHPSMVFTSSNQQLALQKLSLGKLQNSTQYTASFWAKADNAGDKAHTELWGSLGMTNFVLTTDWVRYTAVLTSFSDANTNDSHSNCYFGVPNGNKGNVYIALPKLEKGSLATDWSLAPEDQATVDWTKSQLDIKDGKISAAVTSLKSDITNATAGVATQTWTQGKLDLTAEGFTSQISSVQNGLNEKYTSLEETLKGVQITANNAVTQSQYTQLADQITSVIGDLDNLIIGGDFEDQRAYLGKQSPYWSGYHTIADNSDKNQDTNKSNTVLQINGLVSGNQDVTSKNLVAVRQAEYNINLKTRWSNLDQLGQIIIYAFEFDANKNLIAPQVIQIDKTPAGWKSVAATYKPSSSAVKYMALDVTYKGAESTLPVWVDDIQLGLATATQSQITQLQSDINLRVKTGDLVSQIDVNAKRILLDGASTYITNTTHIDTGVIKTAMIADAAITNGKIANAAIDNAKIANAAINSAKIADLAVGSAQIADGAISSAKIGNAAITSAQIADASILDAKIVNLDGSKIVANSITADKLDVNAIAVGLNTYGSGWQITPASIAFLPAGTDHATISLSGNMGIAYGDSATGEMLGHTYGTPYNMKAGMDWFNGISTELTSSGDYWAVLTEESGSIVRPRLTYSRNRVAELGVFQGWTFDDNTHFGTIGPMDASDYAQMRVVRVQVKGYWCTGLMNSDGSSSAAGILFSDVGHCFIGRNSKWYDLYDIANKLGLGV